MLNSPLRLHSGRYDPLSPLVQPIRVDVLKHTQRTSLSFRFAAFFCRSSFGPFIRFVIRVYCKQCLAAGSSV